MDSSSSDSDIGPSGRFAPREGSNRSSRRRGACMNCRRRKVKCDGVKPICTPCRGVPQGFEDCEYEGVGVSRRQLLEDDIARLERRINELENPAQVDQNPVHLMDPYRSGPSPSRTNITNLDTDPLSINTDLVSAFIENFQAPVFFLSCNNLRNAARSQSLSDQPTSALLNAVYMWALHLDSPRADREQRLLSEALGLLSQDLSGVKSRRILDTVQAQILLSLYFLDQGRTVQAAYQANSAVALAISVGLHLNHTPARHSAPAIHRPSSATEAGERINAFWACLIMANQVSMDHSPVPFSYADPRAAIETPWPLDVVFYNDVSLPSNPSRENTIGSFLSGSSTGTVALPTLLGRASILYERTVHYLRRFTIGPSDERTTSNLRYIARSIDELRRLIHSQTYGSVQSTILARTLIEVATIRIFAAFSGGNADSWMRCVSAYEDAVNALNGVNINALRSVAPIIAPLWAVIGCTLIICLRDAPGGPSSQRRQNAMVSSEKLLTIMDSLAERSPLIRHYAEILRSEFQKL